MFSKFITEITSISNQYEKWFESLDVITALIEINQNCTGSGVRDSIFIKSLHKKINKDKFTFLKMLCMGCNDFFVDIKKHKVTIIDVVNGGNFMIELAYNTDSSYTFVNELVDYIIEHKLINLNSNTGKYEGKTHIIMNKIITTKRIKESKFFYSSFYNNLNSAQQNYLSYKSFMIGLNIFKDKETKEFIERLSKIEPPVDFINKNQIEEIHIFFNLDNRTISTSTSDGTKFNDHCDLIYSINATHIYIENFAMADKVHCIIPIMLKIIDESIYFYNSNMGWSLLGTGILSNEIYKNLIKV